MQFSFFFGRLRYYLCQHSGHMLCGATVLSGRIGKAANFDVGLPAALASCCEATKEPSYLDS